MPLGTGLVTWAAKISRDAAAPSVLRSIWTHVVRHGREARRLVHPGTHGGIDVAGDKEDEELALGQAAPDPGAETVAVRMLTR